MLLADKKKMKMGLAAHGPRINQRQQMNLCARAIEQETDSTEVTSGKTIPWHTMARNTNPPAWMPTRENQKRAEIFSGSGNVGAGIGPHAAKKRKRREEQSPSGRNSDRKNHE
jgi:hypothetical protein